MNYKFYAFRQDFESIFNFIFNELKLSVFQSYSEPGQPLVEFRTVNELLNEIRIKHSALQFILWKKSFAFNYKISKLELNPKYCNGHTFRYRIDGWGLILFQVNGLNKEKLEASSISHNSEKRATAWEATNPGFGKANEVNWEDLNSTSRKLKYYIGNKLATNKVDGTDILPFAEEFLRLNKV